MKRKITVFSRLRLLLLEISFHFAYLAPQVRIG
jgi:hypothetical protein